jgi:hypothetical protein
MRRSAEISSPGRPRRHRKSLATSSCHSDVMQLVGGKQNPVLELVLYSESQVGSGHIPTGLQ